MALSVDDRKQLTGVVGGAPVEIGKRDSEGLGMNVRILVDNEYESDIIDNTETKYYDGRVLSQIVDSKHSATTRWLIDLEEGIPVKPKYKKLLLPEVRLVIVESRRVSVQLSMAAKGYWVPVWTYGIRGRQKTQIDELAKVSRQRLLRLDSSMLYRKPTGVDPYVEQYLFTRLSAVRKARVLPKAYPHSRGVYEVTVDTECGGSYSGYAVATSIQQRKIGSGAYVGFMLESCSEISRTLEKRNEMPRRIASSSPFMHAVEGTVVGLWWPQEHYYSIEVENQIVKLWDSLGVAPSKNKLKIGDWVRAIGELRIFERHPHEPELTWDLPAGFHSCRTS